MGSSSFKRKGLEGLLPFLFLITPQVQLPLLLSCSASGKLPAQATIVCQADFRMGWTESLTGFPSPSKHCFPKPLLISPGGTGLMLACFPSAKAALHLLDVGLDGGFGWTASL